IKRWDIHFCAEYSLGNVDIQIQDHVILTAPEELVRTDIQDQEQASIRTAQGAGSTLPCQADLCTAVHACRDLHFLLDSLTLQPATVTGLAGIGNCLAATVTCGAGRRLNHLPE